jgi:hypothetical protein
VVDQLQQSAVQPDGETAPAKWLPTG